MARDRSLSVLAVAAVVAATVVAIPAVAEAVPVSQALVTGDDPVLRPAVSSDGRFVVFHSEQAFLVPGDSNGFSDVFVLDRLNDTIELVSRPASRQSNGGSSFGDISGDGRFVVFHSQATVLVPGDTNQAWDVFLVDRTSGAIERVSTDAAGGEANGSSYHPSVSDDGRYVAFHSEATNLVAADTDPGGDVYIKDRTTGAVELVSQNANGTVANGRSFAPDLSADGRYVAFESEASDLVATDLNNKWDVFVRDRTAGVTERTSVAADGFGANDNSFLPQISGDGRYVAFESFGTNLVAGDTNAVSDVFLVDRAAPSTTRMSISATGTGQPTDRALAASLSDDGQTVVFHSWAANLDDNDTNNVVDVFMYRVGDAGPTRLSEVGGVGGDGPSGRPAISGDGSTVVFESLAGNLDPTDDDTYWDVISYDVVSKVLAADSPTAAEVDSNPWVLAGFPAHGFVDVVPGAFYEQGVSFLGANGITQGTSPTTFSPNRIVTRAEMATFLFRLNGSQWPTIGTAFADVPETSWYLDPVKWAFEHGITTGTSDTTFSPLAPVTRGQMATFLWRLAGQPTIATPHGFTDVASTSYFEPAVRWLKDSGVTSGTSATEFSPDAAVTRGQMAAFMYRLVATYGWAPRWQPPI